MKLTILLPSTVLLNEEILQMTVQSPAGEYCLKPRHIDFVTVLVPGILTYVDTDSRERFLAVDSGVLVKQEEKVSVATRQATRGELGELVDVVHKMHEEYIEREKVSRSASARLEIGFYKRFLQMSSG